MIFHVYISLFIFQKISFLYFSYSRPVANNTDKITVKMGLKLSQLVDLVIMMIVMSIIIMLIMILMIMFKLSFDQKSRDN